MARIIWMRPSSRASARREKPLTVTNSKPMKPTITRPVGARERFCAMSPKESAFLDQALAAAATLLGAGSMDGEIPERTANSHASRTKAGTSHEISSSLLRLNGRGHVLRGAVVATGCNRRQRMVVEDMRHGGEAFREGLRRSGRIGMTRRLSRSRAKSK